jgi:hypothetical protein
LAGELAGYLKRPSIPADQARSRAEPFGLHDKAHSILSRNENTLAASAKTADRIADQSASALVNPASRTRPRELGR